MVIRSRQMVAVSAVMVCAATASADLIVPGGGAPFTVPGTDFIVTQPGSFSNLARAGLPVEFGPIALEGNPAPGNFFDTAIHRLGDAIFAGVGFSDTIDIEIVALSLRSVSPVAGAGPLAGSFFDIFIDLDPLRDSLGTMTFTHDLPDRSGPDIETYLGLQPKTGTWTTGFDLHLNITLVDTANVFDDFVFENLLLPGYEGTGDWTFGPDFLRFLLGPITELTPADGNNVHEAVQVVPLPAAVWLGVVGLGGVIALRRKKLRRTAGATYTE